MDAGLGLEYHDMQFSEYRDVPYYDIFLYIYITVVFLMLGILFVRAGARPRFEARGNRFMV